VRGNTRTPLVSAVRQVRAGRPRVDTHRPPDVDWQHGAGPGRAGPTGSPEACGRPSRRRRAPSDG